MIETIKYNPSGSIKKIQQPQTEDNIIYMRNYMKNYISRQEPVICVECGCMYKPVYKYKHVKSKIHNAIIDKIKQLTN